MSTADFFEISFLKKNSFRNTISVPNSLVPEQARHFVRPDKMSGLIWVQTICKGYQQTTLVGKILTG